MEVKPYKIILLFLFTTILAACGGDSGDGGGNGASIGGCNAEIEIRGIDFGPEGIESPDFCDYDDGYGLYGYTYQSGIRRIEGRASHLGTSSGLNITWENSATGKSGIGSIATRTVSTKYGSGELTSWSFPFIDLSIGDNPIVITISHGGGVHASTVLVVERRASVEDSTIELSGVFSDESAPIEHALVTPFAIGKPDVPMFASKDTAADGSYTINVFKDAPVSLKFFKANFATLHTAYQAFSEKATGLNFQTVSIVDAKKIIDTAFGGMMLDLSDKAWLAIDVVDSTAADVDGVMITPSQAPAGGGALMCDGTLSGATITVAPPCVPGRTGPMYLAYYDADTEISITVTGSPAINAPVRVGEITLIQVEH